MSNEFQVQIDQHAIPARFLDDAGTAWWMDRLAGRPGIDITTIGKSRAGRDLYGIRIGHGPTLCSITAGAHADEPAGPIAACVLAWLLSEPANAPHMDDTSWVICPQVNPDGAQANSPWFAPIPDMLQYQRHVRREGPGEDIEFGYPGGGKGPLRAENTGVAEFLAAHGPYDFHASLHSMGFAEGAWFLIGKEWADHTDSLRQKLAEMAAGSGFGLHDIDRRGDKGFTRIAPGFCTTPTSTAMQRHFLDGDDPETADKFHFSSMEFIQSLGGDPLVMVSEMPNFAISGGWGESPRSVPVLDTPPPEPGSTAYEKCRELIREGASRGDMQGAVDAARQFQITPVPFAVHVATQVRMVQIAVAWRKNLG